MTLAALIEIRFHAVRKQLSNLYPKLARSTRFKRMALTFAEDENSPAGQAWKDGIIEINLAYFDAYPKTMIREVVPHEVVHVAAYILHGEKGWGHKPRWKALMRALDLPDGRIPNYQDEETL